jgi:hypothetical protein
MPAVRNVPGLPAAGCGCKNAGSSLSGEAAAGDLDADVIMRLKPAALLMGVTTAAAAAAARLGLLAGEMALERARMR